MLAGDVRDPPAAVVEMLRVATVVVVNNVVFDEPLNQAIFRLLKAVLPEACRVISFRDCFPRLRASRDHYVSPDHLLSRFNLPPHSFLSEPNCASWTSSPIRYFVYSVVPENPHAALSMTRRAQLPPEELQRHLDEIAAWRVRCEELARRGIEAEWNELVVECEATGGQPEEKRRRPNKSRSDHHRRASAPAPEHRAAPAMPVSRKPHWEYIEEKAFFLPPSPDRPRGRRRAALEAAGGGDDIQTRGLDARHKAIIRQRPTAADTKTPVMTRRQRRMQGAEVVELRKTVIWVVPEGLENEDYCCICCVGGVLLCCDGICYRSFHLACLNLEQAPEGEFLCELCKANVYSGEQCCDSCGIQGLISVQCKCGKNFHADCIGVDSGSLEEFVCLQCEQEKNAASENVNDVAVVVASPAATDVVVSVVVVEDHHLDVPQNNQDAIIN